MVRSVVSSSLLPSSFASPAPPPAPEDPWAETFPPLRRPNAEDVEDMGMLDAEDGVYRCLDCLHEIWDGVCSECGREYHGHFRDEEDEEVLRDVWGIDVDNMDEDDEEDEIGGFGFGGGFGMMGHWLLGGDRGDDDDDDDDEWQEHRDRFRRRVLGDDYEPRAALDLRGTPDVDDGDVEIEEIDDDGYESSFIDDDNDAPRRRRDDRPQRHQERNRRRHTVIEITTDSGSDHGSSHSSIGNSSIQVLPNPRTRNRREPIILSDDDDDSERENPYPPPRRRHRSNPNPIYIPSSDEEVRTVTTTTNRDGDVSSGLSELESDEGSVSVSVAPRTRRNGRISLSDDEDDHDQELADMEDILSFRGDDRPSEDGHDSQLVLFLSFQSYISKHLYTEMKRTISYPLELYVVKLELERWRLTSRRKMRIWGEIRMMMMMISTYERSAYRPRT